MAGLECSAWHLKGHRLTMVKYDDLYLFPPDHPPSPYDHPVLIVRMGKDDRPQVGAGYLPAGLRLYAVGWLEEPGFPTGSVPDACIQALIRAHPGRILSDGCRGLHTCCLCGGAMPPLVWKGKEIQLKGHGHYLVGSGDMVYMAPELLLHYICDHVYRPPQEFIDAVIAGGFMAGDDLHVVWKD